MTQNVQVSSFILTEAVIWHPFGLCVMLFCIKFCNIRLSKETSPYIGVMLFVSASESSNSYPSGRPLFKNSLITWRSSSSGSIACIRIGCMEYSNFVVRFRSETNARSFSLCSRIIPACFLVAAGNSGLSSISLE